MKISRTKFIIIFLVSAFAFQFISNSFLGPEIRLFPMHRAPFPGADSSIAWHRTLSTIILPIKAVLIGPLLSLFKLPDPPPPLLVLAFALYWTILALVLYFLLSKIKIRKKA